MAPTAEEAPMVLLVEDDPVMLLLTSKVLRSGGYRLLVAADGVSAVSMAMESRPDLVLMDLSLPLLDGSEAARQIKECLPGTPVVALTAHAMQGDRERALADGFDEFMTKPYEITDLLDVAATFARSRKAK
jgi:CheY-like chemotaxis protein